jgi:hypothetical protein
MCNDYEQHVRRADYCRMMQALELHIPGHQSELHLAPTVRAAKRR